MKQIIRFGIIGTIGFGVDAFILIIGVNVFFFSIEISRFISFLCAVFVTWLLNRNFTFSKNTSFTKKREYTLYLIIQSTAALINYTIFIIFVNRYYIFENYLILPLAIASIIAMFFNYFMIKKLIYSKK